jgi:hypothetical protein
MPTCAVRPLLTARSSARWRAEAVASARASNQAAATPPSTSTHTTTTCQSRIWRATDDGRGTTASSHLDEAAVTAVTELYVRNGDPGHVTGHGGQVVPQEEP